MKRLHVLSFVLAAMLLAGLVPMAYTMAQTAEEDCNGTDTTEGTGTTTATVSCTLFCQDLSNGAAFYNVTNPAVTSCAQCERLRKAYTCNPGDPAGKHCVVSSGCVEPTVETTAAGSAG